MFQKRSYGTFSKDLKLLQGRAVSSLGQDLWIWTIALEDCVRLGTVKLPVRCRLLPMWLLRVARCRRDLITDKPHFGG